MRTATLLRAGAAALAVCLGTQSGTVRAQAPSSGSPTLRVPPKNDVSPSAGVTGTMVTLPVCVRDKRGLFIHSLNNRELTKESFALQVDGKPQTVGSFSRDQDTPLTLGLLVDTSMGQREALEEERSAMKGFVNGMLSGPAERDKGFVVQFARQTDLLQDVTPSKTKLEAAIQQLETVAGSKGGSKDSTSGVDPVNGSSSGVRGGTTLYDAVFLSCDEVIARQKGRKALIILSDGNDRGSKESLNSAIEAAQRAETLLYTIYIKGRQDNSGTLQPGRDPDDYPPGYPGGYPGGYPAGYPGGYPGGYPSGYPGDTRMPRSGPPQPNGRKTLEHMAQETGGRSFDLTRKENLAGIYEQIAKDLRSQYRIAFTPDKAGSAAGYHRIELSLTTPNAKEYVIQTPAGYYSGD